jgi:hypothetical protein
MRPVTSVPSTFQYPAAHTAAAGHVEGPFGIAALGGDSKERGLKGTSLDAAALRSGFFAEAMPVIAAPQTANRWRETDRGMIARLPTPVAADLPRLP